MVDKRDEKQPVEGVFSITFNTFVTPRLAGVVHFLGMLVVGLTLAWLVWSAYETDTAFAGSRGRSHSMPSGVSYVTWLSFFGALLAFGLYALVSRVVLESVVVFFGPS